MPIDRLVRSVALLAAVATACGGDGRTPTGLDPDRPLSDLDEPELELVCRTLYHADLGLDDDELHRWGCYVGAIALGRAFPLLFDCEEAARDCLADPGPDDGDVDAEDCDLDADDLAELPACALIPKLVNWNTWLPVTEAVCAPPPSRSTMIPDPWDDPELATPGWPITLLETEPVKVPVPTPLMMDRAAPVVPRTSPSR